MLIYRKTTSTQYVSYENINKGGFASNEKNQNEGSVDFYEKFANGEEKCINDELPFEIPSFWEWVRLGNVANIKMGQSPKGENVFKKSEIKNGVEFHQGKIYFGDKIIKESEQLTIQPTKIAEKGSILLCVRAPVGKINFTDRNICIGRGLCALDTCENKNPSIQIDNFPVYFSRQFVML